MIEDWFLVDAERRNRASDIRNWTTGNAVEPLVDGASYFPALYGALCETRAGDQIYFADFRADTEELLSGPGTSVRSARAWLATGTMNDSASRPIVVAAASLRGGKVSA